MKIVAVLLASGTGSRTKLKEPKQVLRINKKLLFQYALEPLLDSHSYKRIIIVSSKETLRTIKKIIQKEYTKYPIEVILGGETRQESIRKSLALLSKEDCDLILFQDAVRPFTKKEDYTSVISQSSVPKNDGAIVVEPIKGLVVSSKKNTITKIGNSMQYLTHMPECYKISTLKKLYSTPRTKNNKSLTNLETMLSNKKKIALVVSNITNVKVTFPEDVIFVKQHLKK